MTSLETKKALDAYHGKRVLVTGASGFVGTHLLDALAASAAEVAIVTRNPAHARPAGNVFVGNISDKGFLSQVVQDWSPQIIFHLAGARERGLEREAFDQSIAANLTGTLNLLFAARDVPRLECLVILGTGEEYGGNRAPFIESMRESPISAYSFAKQCATQLSQLMHVSFGLPVAVLRPAVAYGPGQASDMFLPALIQTLLRGEEFRMTPGGQSRDYVYVDDLVDAILRSGLCPQAAGEIINIGSGQATRIAELVDRVQAQLGESGRVRKGALPYRNGEPMEYLLDIGKARRLLDWQPRTSLEEGLQRTIDWYRRGGA
jgi:UDP-glucose 4-epimerase